MSNDPRPTTGASGPSRRSLLSGAALGSATLIAGTATKPFLAAAAAAPPVMTSADLEARALALEPPVLLFETQVPDLVVPGAGSTLSLSDTVARMGHRSMRWDHEPRSVVELHAPLGVDPSEHGRITDVFSLWVHTEQPVDGPLRIEFGRGAETDAWCDVNLDFTGWRTAWIRYEDLEGSLAPAMDTVRLVAPDTRGSLHVDLVVLRDRMRRDHPAPDRQVPFVNPEVGTAPNAHWLGLLRFSELLAGEAPATTSPSSEVVASLREVEDCFQAMLTHGGDVTDRQIADLARRVQKMGVPGLDADEPGRAIISYQLAVVPEELRPALATYVDGVPLRTYTDLMEDVGRAYAAARRPRHHAAIGALYQRMFLHLREQGWADGSVTGTIHHLGYQFRGYYNSVWLMRDALHDRGLLETARADIAWFTGFGRTLGTGEGLYSGIVDILNTTLQGMVVAALVRPDDAERAAYLQLVQQWLDRTFTVSPGLLGGFKPDDAFFHHLGMYPDYGRDGITGSAATIVALSGTVFRLGVAGHELLKSALLTMRVYANTFNWPMPLTCRHPTGKTGLSLRPFQELTRAGTPDGSHDLDPEIGAAFLRLLPSRPSVAQRRLVEDLTSAGVRAEAAPSGTWAMNTGAVGLHRREDWLVTAKGHNRYVWSTEIYESDNLYGRYSTYGQLYVLGTGRRVTNRASGFVQPGWDWNRWPGTTAKHLPYVELRAVFEEGDIQEMLLTDSRFCGTGTLAGRAGVFGMDLHEHPKYDASHRARKSVFFFDDVVVALGAGIGNDDTAHPTETTLFQCALDQRPRPVHDSRLGEVSSFPFSSPGRRSDEPLWLVDPVGNGYYVSAGQSVSLVRDVQVAPDQSGEAEGSADFATAWLEHGSAPSDGSYEYAVVVGATAEEMVAFAAGMERPGEAAYEVLRRDTSTHVVRHGATGTVGYAVFEPVDDLAAGVVRATDTPLLIVTAPDGDQVLVSVTDPDLRLYEGRDADQYAADGTFVGATDPYDRPWVGNESRAHVATVVLDGAWRLAAPSSAVTVEVREDRTDLLVTCSGGLGVEVRLTPA